ncbi:hypothetical protein [Spirosoma areae]
MFTLVTLLGQRFVGFPFGQGRHGDGGALRNAEAVISMIHPFLLSGVGE